jgi:hypothetical protein
MAACNNIRKKGGKTRQNCVILFDEKYEIIEATTTTTTKTTTTYIYRKQRKVP